MLRLGADAARLPCAAQLTISTSRVGMGVTGGTPYGFDVGTKAGSPGGPFIEGVNQGVVGMQARAPLHCARRRGGRSRALRCCFPPAPGWRTAQDHRRVMRGAAACEASLTLLRLRAAAVPPELGYGKLQVQEIPPVRAMRAACAAETRRAA